MAHPCLTIMAYLYSATIATGWLSTFLAHDDGRSRSVVMVLVGAGLFGAVSLLILLLISRSIRELRQGADRFAQGDLSQRVAVRGPLPLAKLAESLNVMSSQLQGRLSAVVRQRNELGAVLSSMVEGVLAIDDDERILSLNSTAAQLLQVDPAQAIGRSIQEAVRNSALQDFVRQTLRQNKARSADICLKTEDETPRHLQGQSAILCDEASQRIGAVLVLHDVTHLRRLESIRQEFVANVSHEVKTPVSAIKAAVETLLDDLAYSQDHNANAPTPEDMQRFLKIIARQADRLAAIVEDLLSLARIEQETGRIKAELMPTAIASVIRGACETTQAGVDEKQMSLQVQLPPQLEIMANPPLLEQALVNLITNAIKYSAPETDITIRAEQTSMEIVLSVTDQGRGIEPEHLPRIFERFYRTDKARSRALGGTGLGLSIVKHVAEAHGGRVSADSTLGKGSTFRIHLPHVENLQSPIADL